MSTLLCRLFFRVQNPRKSSTFNICWVKFLWVTKTEKRTTLWVQKYRLVWSATHTHAYNSRCHANCISSSSKTSSLKRDTNWMHLLQMHLMSHTRIQSGTICLLVRREKIGYERGLRRAGSHRKGPTRSSDFSSFPTSLPITPCASPSTFVSNRLSPHEYDMNRDWVRVYPCVIFVSTENASTRYGVIDVRLSSPGVGPPVFTANKVLYPSAQGFRQSVGLLVSYLYAWIWSMCLLSTPHLHLSASCRLARCPEWWKKAERWLICIQNPL